MFEKQSQQQKERDIRKTKQGSEEEDGQNGATKGSDAGTGHEDVDDAAATDLSLVASSDESSESGDEADRELQPATKRSRLTIDDCCGSNSNEKELPSATERPGPSPSPSSCLPASKKKKDEDQGMAPTKFQLWQRKTVFLVELLNTLQPCRTKSNNGMESLFLGAVKEVRSNPQFKGLNTKWVTTATIQGFIVTSTQKWSRHCLRRTLS